MGRRTAPAAAGQVAAQKELLVRFARLMWERHGARIYLFGSRARGMGHAESDYDLVAVAQVFEGQHRLARAEERYRLWREAGGMGIGLDLHCYTPAEFREELAGLGFVGQSRRRGELIRVNRGRAGKLRQRVREP